MSDIHSLDGFDLSPDQKIEIENLFSEIPEIFYELRDDIFTLVEFYENLFDGRFRVRVTFSRDLTDNEIKSFCRGFNIVSEDVFSSIARVDEIVSRSSRNLEFIILLPSD